MDDVCKKLELEKFNFYEIQFKSVIQRCVVFPIQMCIGKCIDAYT